MTIGQFLKMDKKIFLLYLLMGYEFSGVSFPGKGFVFKAQDFDEKTSSLFQKHRLKITGYQKQKKSFFKKGLINHQKNGKLKVLSQARFNLVNVALKSRLVQQLNAILNDQKTDTKLKVALKSFLKKAQKAIIKRINEASQKVKFKEQTYSAYQTVFPGSKSSASTEFSSQILPYGVENPKKLADKADSPLQAMVELDLGPQYSKSEDSTETSKKPEDKAGVQSDSAPSTQHNEPQYKALNNSFGNWKKRFPNIIEENESGNFSQDIDEEFDENNRNRNQVYIQPEKLSMKTREWAKTDAETQEMSTMLPYTPIETSSFDENNRNRNQVYIQPEKLSMKTREWAKTDAERQEMSTMLPYTLIETSSLDERLKKL